MRLRDISIWFVGLLVAAVLIIAAGTNLDYINSQRQQMKLIINEPLENAPPSLAFVTVAMGAFRGLVVDILWLRADRLKEQGQFFDAKQLAEWITILQPRFASVWEFQAWNMAYNISVAMPQTQPQERWRWVKNGYELLRDKGIPLNPKSIVLYRELARIFQHKIGSVSDEVHKYYKLQLAKAMEPLIGPADNQTFEALAEAPASWQHIMQDANVTPLIKFLKSADKVFVDDEHFVSNYLSLRQSPSRFNQRALEVVDDFRGTEALKKLDFFAKAYQLRNVWKLDPILMRQLNKLYGPIDWNDPNKHLPLDWRHPDSHAIYWAVKGLEVAGKKGPSTGNEMDYTVAEVNTDRIVGHSLQNLFRNGKIFIYKMPVEASPDSSSQEPQQLKEEIFLRPDLRMFEPYNQAIVTIIEKYTDPNDKKFSTHKIGHRNMLKNAVLSFYQAGHRRQAQEIYEQLRKLYPLDDFKVPFVIFVRNRLREELETLGLQNAKEIVEMMLRESYFRFALRDDNEAAGLEKMAEEAYDHYRNMYRDENRIDLPDLRLLRYLALLDFINDQQYPPNLRLNLLARIRVERPDLAEQLKQQEEKLLKQLEQSQ
jgi:hypothetical protein